jgi:hypothetical protein
MGGRQVIYLASAFPGSHVHVWDPNHYCVECLVDQPGFVAKIEEMA